MNGSNVSNLSAVKVRKLDDECAKPERLIGVFERYQQAVTEKWMAGMLKGRSAFSRKGPYSARLVTWMMIHQRLHPKGTLSVGVRELLSGPAQAFVKLTGKDPAVGLSANTSAYSQARSRLTLDLVEQAADVIFESMLAQSRTVASWDRPMFLLDGSSVLLSNCAELVAAYPPQPNQYGESHWPVMRVVAAHDVVAGWAVRMCHGPMNGPMAVSEQGLAKEMMRRLPAGCGVMGDRNFGVFSMAHHAHEQNHPCLFRLMEVRARKMNGGVTPSSKTDRVIQWVSSPDDRRNNPELPAQASVAGRLLAFKVTDEDGKQQKLYFFTTLDLTADQILELYGYRWNIETDLRTLKRHVRLDMLDVKSKAMAEKELVIAVAAYNLTRATINDAATALNLNPRDFSYSMAQDTLNAFLPAFANASSEPERQQIAKIMLRVLSQSKLPRRSQRRSFTREVWSHPCSFPYRKIAQKTVAAERGKKVA
jgi:hypothetical protein